jgi:transmembrane sensor
MTERTDLIERIERVGSRIDAGLTDDDVERLIEGSRQRRRRKTVVRAGVVSALAGAAAVVVFRLVSGTAAPIVVQSPPGAAPSRPAPALPVLRLADGSGATALDADSVLTVAEDVPERVSLDLLRGRQRFDVVPRPQRSFVVRAGDVSVTVVGTVFTVERIADRIGVTVERGRVLVDWRTGRRALAAGDSGWFPPLQIEARAPETEPMPAHGTPAPRRRPAPAPRPGEAAAATAPAPAVTPPPAVAPAPGVAPPPAAAAAGAAAPALAKAPPTAPARAPRPAAPAPSTVETAERLLAAADRAREAGRADDGVALLRRLLAEHPRDPRAPLAAFTLGRVLLMELGRPREAAAAFAQARALAPQGPFAEDALAREVEALAKAGAEGDARARAREYLRLYPDGRRAHGVKALGGTE